MGSINDSSRKLCRAIRSMMVAPFLVFFVLLPQVRGAAYTFTNSNTGTYDYTSGTGWSPGAPVGGFTNSLIFGNGASLAAGANVTVSNNLGFVRFNSITVNYAGPGSGTAPTFTLGGQGVTLSSSNGSNPFILISNTGTVRHQTPRENRIERNAFKLSGLRPGSYGVWIGSRQGRRTYCEADAG